jgi:hypothetical protein
VVRQAHHDRFAEPVLSRSKDALHLSVLNVLQQVITVGSLNECENEQLETRNSKIETSAPYPAHGGLGGDPELQSRLCPLPGFFPERSL